MFFWNSLAFSMIQQMFKQDLEKAEEPEIKLATSVGSSRKQENSRKTSTSALLTTLKPLTVWIITNWKTLHLSPEYVSQEATVRTLCGTNDRFKIEKRVQVCLLSPCLLSLYAEYIMQNARLDELQAGIKTAGRNINNLRNADDTTLMAENEEELKAS